MAISDYYNKTATLTKKTESSTNEYGESTFTESTSTFSCALQPNTGLGSTTTTGVGFRTDDKGVVVETTHFLYCAITIAIEPGDKVTIDGNDYKVIHVNDGAGRGHHLECGLKLVE